MCFVYGYLAALITPLIYLLLYGGWCVICELREDRE